MMRSTSSLQALLRTCEIRLVPAKGLRAFCGKRSESVRAYTIAADGIFVMTLHSDFDVIGPAPTFRSVPQPRTRTLPATVCLTALSLAQSAIQRAS